jgi:phosphatidylglycerol:prolipoprotein diacylglycerol transferase
LAQASTQNALVVSGVCGLLAARLSFMPVAHQAELDLDLLAFRQGGLLGAGAVLGGIAGAYVFFKRIGGFWPWLDAAAPAFCASILLVRIGCYLYGCDYGTRLTASAPRWLAAAGRFPRWQDPDQATVRGSPPWLDQVAAGQLEPAQAFAHPVHPLQLYEAAGGLALLALACLMLRRQARAGQTGLTVLLGYAVMRFVFELHSGDPLRGWWGPHLSPSVLSTIGLLPFAAAFAYGPGTSIPPGTKRRLALAACLLPAALSLWLVRGSQPVQLTLTQWMALLAAGWVAHAWSTLERATSDAETSAAALGSGSRNQQEQRRSTQPGGEDSNR